MTDKQPEALKWADAVECAHMPQLAEFLRTQHAEIERLNDDLAFVERWANHHGAKPHTTPQEALSVIQHYPPIKAITRSYKDGVVPDTFDPYAAIERKDALLRQALEMLGCTHEDDDPGHRCGHCDEYVDRNGTLRSAITKELSQ